MQQQYNLETGTLVSWEFWKNENHTRMHKNTKYLRVHVYTHTLYEDWYIIHTNLEEQNQIEKQKEQTLYLHSPPTHHSQFCKPWVIDFPLHETKPHYQHPELQHFPSWKQRAGLQVFLRNDRCESCQPLLWCFQEAKLYLLDYGCYGHHTVICSRWHLDSRFPHVAM